jgi:LmbE family N-acetylglucosaminyl deacetylase
MKGGNTMTIILPTAQHIYIGAHLDDIILSCAGTITQQAAKGESVAALTVFAGSPEETPETALVQELHQRWREAFDTDTSRIDINAVRRGEDILAFATISHGIEVVHHTLTDCIYRLHPQTGEPLYASEVGIFGAVHPADPALDDLSAAPQVPDETTLYIPLAVGNHVDHQIIRQSVEGWGLPTDRLTYYEDFPYVMGEGELEKAIDMADGWEATVNAMADDTLQVKKDAVLQYVSQISTFWQSSDELVAMLLEHNQHTGGERFWVR